MSNSLDPDQPNILSGLNWVQNVRKGYRQTTLLGKELIKESVYAYIISTYISSAGPNN